jgi:hypothetical protein
MQLFPNLPRDLEVAILEKVDIDTRIKVGYIRKLKIPQQLQDDLTATFGKRDSTACSSFVNLGRTVQVGAETVLTLYSIVRMFTAFAGTKDAIMFEERVDYLQDSDPDDVYVRIFLLHSDDFMIYIL